MERFSAQKSTLLMLSARTSSSVSLRRINRSITKIPVPVTQLQLPRSFPSGFRLANLHSSLTPRFSAFILKYCSLRDLRLCAHFRGPSRYGVGAAEVPMFIEIKDLESQPIDFREEFSPGAIDLGPDLQQRSLLHTEGRADLVEKHHGKHKVVQDIRLKGKLGTILVAAG